MDGDSELPFDFFSQTASSGAAVHHIDEDGWGMTPPRLRGSAGRGLVAGGLDRGSVAGGLGRGSVAGGSALPSGWRTSTSMPTPPSPPPTPTWACTRNFFIRGVRPAMVCPSSGPDRTAWRSGKVVHLAKVSPSEGPWQAGRRDVETRWCWFKSLRQIGGRKKSRQNPSHTLSLLLHRDGFREIYSVRIQLLHVLK
ncbi:hypothetical protein ZWY2020_032910 [Hordeum vulgare]|nr:hypothetical protein ZWY2020_032910 [Hordeum vulgare]